MFINYRYEETENAGTDGYIKVYANDAPIGVLYGTASSKDLLIWSPDKRVCNVKFQFRNDETFLTVVNELRRYKNEKGFKYLTIWSHKGEYADLLNKELIKKAGFYQLPDAHPACYFVE